VLAKPTVTTSSRDAVAASAAGTGFAATKAVEAAAMIEVYFMIIADEYNNEDNG
jgi:hypothetical protein